MIKLESVFKNHFESSKISDDNLAKFAQDHLARLRAAAPAMDAIAAETEAAYLNYTGNVSGEDIKTVQRIAATFSTDELLQEFKAEVSRQEGLIRSQFGKTSAEYLLFFPQGISEYTTATKANVQTLMERMAVQMQAHIQTLPPAVADRFAQLFTDYRNSRDVQLERAGGVSTLKTTTSGSRHILELRLCANLHYIGYTYPGDVEKCLTFFDQSIINYNTHKASDGIGRAAGTITSGGEPLAGAAVSYKDLNLPVVHTKADGTYRGRNIAIGLHTLVISKPGYHTAEVQVEVVDDGDTVVDVELEKE